MNGGALYQITTYAIISFYENYSKPLVILSLIFGIVVLLEIYSLPTLWHKIKEIFSNNKDPDESKQGQREQHSPTLHPKRIKSSPPHFNPNNNGKLKKYGFSKKLERNKKKKDQLSCGGEDKLVASTSLRQLSSVEKDFHLESKPLPPINDVKSINDAFNGTPTLPAQPSPKAESKKCVSKNTPKLVPKGETDSSNLFSEPFVEVSRRHTNNISKNSQAPLPKLNKKVFLKHQGSKGELVSSKALSSHQKVMTHLVVNSSNKIKANALAKNETHPNNNNSFKLSLNEIEKSWKEYDEWSDLKTQSLAKTIETSCGNNSSARLPLKLYSSVLRDITLTTLNEPKIALSETNCTDNSIEKCKVGEWQTSEKIQITPKVPCTLEMDCTIVHQLKRSCELLMEKNEELLAEKSKGPPEESEFKFLTSWDDDEIFLGENKNSLSKFVPSSFPLTNIQIYPNQITHNIHESIEKEAIKEKEITSAYDYTLALFTNANNEERSSFADAPPFKSPFEDDGSWTSSLFFTPGATETKSNRFRFPISLNSELPNKTSETPAESSSDYNSMTPSPSSAGKEANLNNNCFFNQSAASHYSLEKTLLKGSDAFFTAPLCEYNPFIFPTPLGTIGYDGVEDGDEEPFEETVEEYDPSSIKKFIEIMIDTGDIDVEKHKSIKMRSHDLVTRPPFFTKPVIEQLPELPIRNTIIHKFPTFDEIQLENGYFEDKPSNKIPIQVVKPLCQPRAKRILKITKPTKPTPIERKIIPSKPPRLFAQKQQLPRQQRLLMTTATFFQPLYPINLRIVHVKQPHFKPQMMPPHYKSPVMQQFKLQLSPMFRQQFISPFNIQQPLPQMIHQPNPNPNLAPSQRQLNNIFRGNVCVQPLVQKIIPIKTFRDLCHFKETLYVLSHSLIKSEKIVVDKSLYTFLSYELEVKPSNVGFLTGVIVYRGIVSTNTYSNDGYIMDAQVLVNYYPKETSEDANPITAKGIIISIKPPIYYKSFTCIQVVVLIESLQSGLLLPNEFKAVIAKYTTSKICLRSFINTYPETTTELDIFTETISNSAAGQCFFKSMIDSFIPPPSKTFDDVNVAPMSNILDDDQIAMIKICLRNKTIASAYSMPGSGKTFAATEIANQDCFGMQIYVTHSDASADLLLRHFERFSKHKVRPFPLFNLSHRTPGSEYYESGEFGLYQWFRHNYDLLLSLEEKNLFYSFMSMSQKLNSSSLRFTHSIFEVDRLFLIMTELKREILQIIWRIYQPNTIVVTSTLAKKTLFDQFCYLSPNRIILDDAKVVSIFKFLELINCFPHASYVLLGEVNLGQSYEVIHSPKGAKYCTLMLPISYLCNKRGIGQTCSLKTCYRYPWTVMSFLKTYFNSQKIQTMSQFKKNPKADNILSDEFEMTRLAFVDTWGTKCRKIFLSPSCTSYKNSGEIRVLFKILGDLQSRQVKAEDIGIITFFDKQKDCIQKCFRQNFKPQIGSATHFIGIEKKYIIVCTTKTSLSFKEKSLLHTILTYPYNLLTSLTRSTSATILLGDAQFLCNFHSFNLMIGRLRDSRTNYLCTNTHKMFRFINNIPTKVSVDIQPREASKII